MTNLTEASVERLLKIEAAATAYRRSLEGDGWSKDDIELGICRPGIRELMELIPASPQDDFKQQIP